MSIDREYRKLNKSYWSEEIPSMEQRQKLIDNLDNIGADYLLTHTTSEEEIHAFDRYAFTAKITDDVACFLRFIRTQYEFKHHWFGHFHLNKTVPELKSTCLYDKILRIG